MQSFKIDEELVKLLQNSKNRSLAEDALQFTFDQLECNHLQIEGYRWQALANHVVTMVDRSVTGEVFMDVDIALFYEVSAHSIEMADEIVHHIGNLDDREKFLLSVHFEIAKVYPD